jgi:hypothetical protein
LGATSRPYSSSAMVTLSPESAAVIST